MHDCTIFMKTSIVAGGTIGCAYDTFLTKSDRYTF